MRVVRIALPIGILALGIVSLFVLVSTKPEAKKVPRSNRGTVVEIQVVEPSSERVSVLARGTVLPARQVPLGPEVGGKVIAVAEKLEPGGRFAEGELLIRVDPSEYRLAMQQQFAAVDSAQTQLEIEQSRKKIAEREWELFEKERASKDGSAVALREPQLRTAKVNLEAAESGLQRARLNVARTLVKAPFNGVIQARNVELGQMVAPGTPVATLVGTDHYWVQVSVPLAQLAWIDVPGVRGVSEGSTAVVRQRIGDESIVRSGRVIRLLSDVDPAGRMARLLVEIDDPLGLEGEAVAAAAAGEGASSVSELPLLLGAYVEVEIQGRAAAEVFEVPRVALHEGEEVYLMGEDDTLVKRAVGAHVLWRREDTVLLSGGVSRGDRLIVSPVPAPIEGMTLRLPGAASSDGAGDEAAEGAAASAPAAPAGDEASGAAAE